MADYKNTTGKSIVQAFNEFHAANPHIYQLFLLEANRAIEAGGEKFSFKAILNYLRWFNRTKKVDLEYIKIVGDNRSFKVNDAYSAHYARLFVKEYPQHAGKVELRELRAPK